jgi:hypothetical protein
MDDRERVLFTFIRRPSYYATFNSGPHLTGQQRYGLGLLWNPQIGTVIQSQTGSNNAAWGTLLGQNQIPFEGDTLNAEFRNEAKVITPQPGNRNLPAGMFSIKYGFPDQGEKVLTFKSHELVVDIEHSGGLREQIPLLVSDTDELKVIPGAVTIKRGVHTFSIHFDPQVKAETIETELKVGQRRVVTLFLQSRNTLTYTMSFGS